MKAKYKVGDKVRVIKNDISGHGFDIGEEVLIRIVDEALLDEEEIELIRDYKRPDGL